MKLLAAFLLAALAAAAPSTELQVRQTAGSYSSSMLESGGCKGSTFIWTRGTLEPGNMGWIIGNYLTPILTKGLNNDIAVQGVKYDAGILTNIGAGMADPAGVKEATRLIQLAISKCPNTIITGGGYSQGAAIMHRAIEKMSEDVKSKITAILLYGDTQFPQDGPKIKGFPQDKVKVICKSDDGVCVGGITVTPGHLSYSGSAAEGANWLIEKIKSAKAGGSSSSSSSSGDSGSSSSPAPSPKGKGSAPKAGAKGSSPKGPPKGSSGKGVSPPPEPPAPETPAEAPTLEAPARR